MAATTTESNLRSRPRRQAAIEADKSVREILEWECLPENSAKFQRVAAEFDKQFEAERQAKLVDDGDIEDGDASDLHEENSDAEMSGQDEEMNEEDKDFVENDSEYDESDATFVLSDSEKSDLSSDHGEENTNIPNLTMEEELMDCLDEPEHTAATHVLETEADDFEYCD